MGLYEDLCKQKEDGISLDYKSLSIEVFKQLSIEEEISDKNLAELFDVKQSKITYWRNKHGITIKNSLLDDLLQSKSERAKEINLRVKNEIFRKENISLISKAITHFAFRNGPIEDMHASPNNQLSDKDMEILNKFMVNRLAYVFSLMIEERWIEFDFLVRSIDSMYGRDWDEAEPDDGGNREVIEMLIKSNK